MTEQPTPRTDAAWQSVTVSAPWDAAAEQMAQHARELERELAEAREQIEANHKATELIEQMIYAERALADRLAGQMERWRELVGDLCTPSAADEALAAWKAARNEAVNPP